MTKLPLPSLFLCLSVPSFALTVAAQDARGGLELVLELRSDPLRVGVTLGHVATGEETAFAVQDRWASARDVPSGLHELGARSATGEELALERSSDGQATTWTVAHPAGELVLLSWELAADGAPIGASPSEHYLPLLREGLLHAIGHTFLVLPAGLDDEEPMDVTLSWVGFEDAGWSTWSSFGDGPEVSFRARPRELRSALYLAGDLRGYEERVGETSLRIVVAGDGFRFSDELFRDRATRIFEAEHAFFDDPGPPRFLISLLPVGTPAERSLGGTALASTFCLFVSPYYGLQEGTADAVDLKRLLAHELFHEWNGRRIRRRQPEERAVWFSEGFTDFYARRILYQAGLLDDAELAREVSRAWAAYWLNPVREARNEEIAAGFWSDRWLKDLPYRRGDLVAQLLDHELARRSGGESDLDDLMRLVLERADGGWLVDTESLLALFTEHTSQEFGGLLEGVVVQGWTPDLPEDLFPGFEIEWLDRWAFDLGFDFPASEAAGRVVGLRPDTAAQEAGLRDGQEVAGWSIRWDRPDEQVVVRIREGGRVRDVRFFPRGAEPVSVPALAH